MSWDSGFRSVRLLAATIVGFVFGLAGLHVAAAPGDAPPLPYPGPNGYGTRPGYSSPAPLPTAPSASGVAANPAVPVPVPETPPIDTRHPKGPILGVAIAGNKTVSTAEIRRHLKSHKDRPYDPQLVQEDVRRLFATRKFQNVQVHRNVVPQGVYLTFEVVERPTMQEVLFIGNKYISDRRLMKETGLAKGEALNIYTLQEARRKIEDLYHRKGYVKTRVTVEEGNKPTDHRAVFRIDEGPIERIWSVRFVGNDPHLVSDERLKTMVKSKPGFLKYLFHGVVDYSTIDEDINTLTAYYRNLGYFQARISRELDYDKSGQWATLTFVIDEGPRYKVRHVELVGNKVFDTASLKERLELKAGDFFNMPKMKKDENTLREIYGSHGYIYADVKASPRFLDDPPGQLDLVYEIKEGEMFRVGEIRIEIAGEYPHTRKSVILNRLSFRPGDIIDTRKVRDSKRRLKASQLFVTNPSEGRPPEINIPPPELKDVESMNRHSRSPDYRGQNGY